MKFQSNGLNFDDHLLCWQTEYVQLCMLCYLYLLTKHFHVIMEDLLKILVLYSLSVWGLHFLNITASRWNKCRIVLCSSVRDEHVSHKPELASFWSNIATCLPCIADMCAIGAAYCIQAVSFVSNKIICFVYSTSLLSSFTIFGIRPHNGGTNSLFEDMFIMCCSIDMAVINISVCICVLRAFLNVCVFSRPGKNNYACQIKLNTTRDCTHALRTQIALCMFNRMY